MLLKIWDLVLVVVAMIVWFDHDVAVKSHHVIAFRPIKRHQKAMNMEVIFPTELSLFQVDMQLAEDMPTSAKTQTFTSGRTGNLQKSMFICQLEILFKSSCVS
ncbi:hypothetical protein J5N97_008502 [Dioscorea zingiberensis]|uniref:Secreted protein n=1 Tax=Dioscorea zingiberensis TaxID=325984 RepID=A0A9D5CX31_9LILI|nr:hypothetical protein J5N97_008502 [Dioscorea zingiberensis]